MARWARRPGPPACKCWQPAAELFPLHRPACRLTPCDASPLPSLPPTPQDDSKKIAELLKHGAHCLHDLGAAAEQSGAFAAEGIEDILQVGLASLADWLETNNVRRLGS